MHLDRLWLTDFRNYTSAELAFPADGLTVILGPNGQGKTNLLEAIGYVASLRSFRGATPDALVRMGADQAIVRAEGERSSRRLLIESEIATVGRSRTLINRQPLRRAKDLSETLLATVFAPDDLTLVKGGPSERRRYIDDLLADGDAKMEALQRDVDRILRQRNTLLRQAGGRLSDEIAITLDVWDAKFADTGEALGRARAELAATLEPAVTNAYQRLVESTHGEQRIGVRMTTPWRTEDGGPGLAEALQEARKADVARGVTTVGPHRDELLLFVNDMPARTHASQGEQRTLALALRLGGHEVLSDIAGVPPILLLDDVFSELDEGRARLLLEELPAGQAFLTTATPPPASVKPQHVIEVYGGAIK